MAVERQSANLPPAQPSYILRGHASQIHSVQFLRKNTRLLTGDADGWIIYWKVETKRALAVWRAHDNAILGTAEWGDKIITHGRDNSLRIWQIRTPDEGTLSTALPAEVVPADRPMPWLLHTLPVNTLNFCAFSMCYVKTQKEESSNAVVSPQPASTKGNTPILVAVPARDDKKAEVYEFPNERLRYVVPRAQPNDTGMVMAVKLAQHIATRQTLVITGYEGGLTAVHLLPRSDPSSVGVAQLMYLSQPHKQPILSLDVLPDASMYFTSGADAIIAAHRMPPLPPFEESMETSATAQEDTESEISAPTQDADSAQAGADSSSEHKDPSHADDPEASDISSLAAADLPALTFTKRALPPTNNIPSPTGLSTLLATTQQPPTLSTLPRSLPPRPVAPTPPHKSTNTKHAGQQSLTLRSDARLLATAGWDARVRIYSAKTLREVAVLKWHREGVYAVGFAEVVEGEVEGETADSDREKGLAKVQREREKRVQRKHWVVAGAKDGKVSLWEVF